MRPSEVTLNSPGRLRHAVKCQDAWKALLTSVDCQQLALCKDVAIGERPHAGNVIGQREVNAGCDRHLAKQVEPACAMWGASSAFSRL